MSAVTKAVVHLRRGDHIVLDPMDRAIANTDQATAQVLKIHNSPFGLVIECTHGVNLHARRDGYIKVRYA